MEVMKISIVIPAYNEEASIGKTIEAVLAQDYKNFEVIVVDNASTDKTSEIAGKYPVKLVKEPKKGLLHARERGRLEATGEIIANIDADCFPDEKWLSRGIKYFENESIVAVTGPYDYFDGGYIFRKFTLFTQKYAYFLMNNLLNFFHTGAILIGGNNFIRARVLKEVGGYTTSLLFYGEDADTAKKVSQKGKVVFDKNLIMKTSARRFKAEGTFKIGFLYFYHFLRVMFFIRK